MQKGQSLFELVVAIAISALIIVAVVSLVTVSIRNATYSKNNALAVSLAQNTVEWLRSQRDENIATFVTNVSVSAPAPTTYCFQNLNWNDLNAFGCGSSQKVDQTPFLRQGTFTVSTDLVTGKKIYEANISVTWSDSQGSHEVTNITDFTDWRER